MKILIAKYQMIFLFFPFRIPYFTVVLVAFFLFFLLLLLLLLLYRCGIVVVPRVHNIVVIDAVTFIQTNFVYTYKITHTHARTHINTNMRGTKYYCINSSRILIWYQNHIRDLFFAMHIFIICSGFQAVCAYKIYTHRNMYWFIDVWARRKRSKLKVKNISKRLRPVYSLCHTQSTHSVCFYLISSAYLCTCFDRLYYFVRLFFRSFVGSFIRYPFSPAIWNAK